MDSSSSPASPAGSQPILSSLPTGSAHIAYTMAALNAIGGVAGYAKVKSSRSLLAGILLGGAFGLSGYYVSSGEALRGYRFAAMTSAIMTLAMGQRFYRTKKAMPAGVLAVLGGASTAYHGYKYADWQGWLE